MNSEVSPQGKLQNSKPGETWETNPTGVEGILNLPGFPNFEVGKWFLEAVASHRPGVSLTHKVRDTLAANLAM